MPPLEVYVIRRLLVLAALSVLMPSTAYAGPILLNGSFELGPPPFLNQDIAIASGSTAITGWLVTAGGIDLLEDPWNVSDGLRAVDLDGRTPGGIQQSFATVAGQQYSVFFDLSGNPGNGLPGTGLPLIKSLRVGVDGFSHDYSFDSTGLSIDSLIWRTITFSFIASADSATLSFVSLSPAGNAYGALIDNVSVHPVPEPSSLTIFGCGLLVLVAGRLRSNPRETGGALALLLRTRRKLPSCPRSAQTAIETIAVAG